MNPNLAVVHSVREIGSGGGVSGVAHALDLAFKKAGVPSESFTLANLGLDRSRQGSNNLVRKRLRLLFDVVYFSTIGTLVGLVHCRGKIVICHNDGMFGEIYVNHGLHKALLKQSGRMGAFIFRNPIHLFLLVREWLRFKLRLHRRFVCFAQSEAELMMQHYPQTKGRIVIIPNGVDVQRFQPDAGLRTEARKQWGFAADQFVVSFVGHEYDRKGLYPLVKALSLLPDNVVLLVAGGTAEEMERGKAAALTANVRNRVTFVGIYREVERIMNASDVFVLPSKFESWALVGLEAMACGIPVIIKPTGGISDYLHDGENGFFITEEPTDIAAQIKRTMHDSAAYRLMSLQARRTALRFSWEVVANKYVQLLSSLTNGGGEVISACQKVESSRP